MKATANVLRNVSHTVLDLEVTLNLLLGLNPSSNVVNNIVDFDLLSNFVAAREKLALKEPRLANEGKIAS